MTNETLSRILCIFDVRQAHDALTLNGVLSRSKGSGHAAKARHRTETVVDMKRLNGIYRQERHERQGG